jgi:hypothetical protein
MFSTSLTESKQILSYVGSKQDIWPVSVLGLSFLWEYSFILYHSIPLPQSVQHQYQTHLSQAGKYSGPVHRDERP